MCALSMLVLGMAQGVEAGWNPSAEALYTTAFVGADDRRLSRAL